MLYSDVLHDATVRASTAANKCYARRLPSTLVKEAAVRGDASSCTFCALVVYNDDKAKAFF